MSHLQHQATDARIIPEWNSCQIIYLSIQPWHTYSFTIGYQHRRIEQEGGKGGGGCDEEMHKMKNLNHIG